MTVSFNKLKTWSAGEHLTIYMVRSWGASRLALLTWKSKFYQGNTDNNRHVVYHQVLVKEAKRHLDRVLQTSRGWCHIHIFCRRRRAYVKGCIRVEQLCKSNKPWTLRGRRKWRHAHMENSRVAWEASNVEIMRLFNLDQATTNHLTSQQQNGMQVSATLKETELMGPIKARWFLSSPSIKLLTMLEVKWLSHLARIVGLIKLCESVWLG